MIDLHTHLIPGVDDGSDSVEQSVEVLAAFARQGVRAVCCTPHLKAGDAHAAPRAAMESLLAELRDAGPPSVELSLGFEIMMDVPELELGRGFRSLTLAGSRYLLVEFPKTLPAAASVAVLGRLAEQGVVPVLAHPERYAACTVEVAREWSAAGAALQVDATTLLNESRRAERARALIEAGCAGLIASDNHGDLRSMAVAREWLAGHGLRVQAERLCEENPAAILADGELLSVPPQRFRRSWYSQLKQFVVGGQEA